MHWYTKDSHTVIQYFLLLSVHSANLPGSCHFHGVHAISMPGGWSNEPQKYSHCGLSEAYSALTNVAKHAVSLSWWFCSCVVFIHQLCQSCQGNPLCQRRLWWHQQLVQCHQDIRLSRALHMMHTYISTVPLWSPAIFCYSAVFLSLLCFGVG